MAPSLAPSLARRVGPRYANAVTRLTIGVMGAGSIGCFVGGKLLGADAADVVLVGRERLRSELAQHGLSVKDFDEPAETLSPSAIRYETSPDALADCEAVLVCVKSAQTEEVAATLDGVLGEDTVVASFQNGVRNPEVLRAALGARPVVPAVVGFNVVSRGEGLFHRAMSGSLMLERVAHAEPLFEALERARLGVALYDDLAPEQWTKLMVNLNNAVSALSDAPSRQLLLSAGYRKIIAALVGEALAVLKRAQIKPAKLRGVPVGLMPHVLKLPTALVKLVTRAQMRVDPEARSSMWEDLTRGRPTEVDHLNGEIVRLAERVGAEAPLNRRVVELVHAAEAAGAGSPKLDAEALWAALTG